MYRRLTHFLTVAGALLGLPANDPLNATTRSSSARFHSLSTAAVGGSMRRFLPTFHREPAANRFLQVLAFAGILAILSFATVRQAQAQSGPPTEFISKLNNLCLAVNGGKIANSSTLITWTCVPNDPSQTFYFSNGFIRVGSPNSQYCLATFNGQTAGAQTGVWQCTNGPDGKAHPTQAFAPGMWLDLRIGSSGLCLSVQGGNRNAGTPVVLNGCSSGNSPSDMWTAQRPGPLPPPPAPAPQGATVTFTAYSLISGLGSRCLAVQNGSAALGTRLVIWGCQGTPEQLFTFPGDGTIRPFGNRYGNLCLDIQDAKGDGRTMVAGDHPQIYTCNGQKNQQFTFNGGVIQTSNGWVFDLWGGAGASWFSGAVNVQLAARNNQDNQRFVLGGTVPVGKATNSINPDTTTRIMPITFPGSIISHNGSAVVAAGGGNVIAQGGGNVVAQGGGNLTSDASGHVIAQGGGNVVAAGGGNVIVPLASGVIAQGGGN